MGSNPTSSVSFKSFHTGFSTIYNPFKSLGIPFAQELKNSVENALNQYKTSSNLFAIIPGGNKYNTIFQYLFPLIFPEKVLPQNLKLIFDECFDISHIHHILCIESLIMITGTWDTSLFETSNHLYFHGMDFTKIENLLDKSFARRLALFLQQFTPSDPTLLRDLGQIRVFALEYSQK